MDETSQVGTDVLTQSLSSDSDPQGNEPGNKNHRRRNIVVILIIIVLIAAAAVVLWYVSRPASTWYDGGMTMGSYQGETQAQIQAELDKKVAAGEMKVSCAPTILVSSETGQAQVRAENSASNRVEQRFVISDSAGNILYSSGAIALGNHVQSVTLSSIPSKGTYKVTVAFQGYDPTSHKPQGGTVSVQVKMLVQ